MKNNIRLSILLFLAFLISCTKSIGIYEDRLIKLRDAEKDLNILYIAKQLEYFPNTTIVTDLKFSYSSGCDRDIYYDKSDFRKCLRNLAVNPFKSKNSVELSLEFRFFFENSCDLKKVIMFENSAWGGEVNLCEMRKI
ncbi:hypothetical protein EHQ82_01755 [Leptospira selangorensis]|uniref:Lipoprotein n=1 Tax=Leptospira selangorensis TaxID=2484982 RepID=A0ABY2NI24_9LEPT|nr:hypothetical protein [Leptospira selangorensis]TGM27917.1 hypothetical protein EHQ82_01755 [Leptospira selangorensis]